MKTSEYYYGVKGHTFKDMSYIDALGYKIECARELINVLQEKPIYDRDIKRINDILKSIRFNKELIYETED